MTATSYPHDSTPYPRRTMVEDDYTVVTKDDKRMMLLGSMSAFEKEWPPTIVHGGTTYWFASHHPMPRESTGDYHGYVEYTSDEKRSAEYQRRQPARPSQANLLKPTYKAIARAAGYFAWNDHPYNGEDRWAWHDRKGWSKEVAAQHFATEDDAYRDCCVKCGLVIEE